MLFTIMIATDSPRCGKREKRDQSEFLKDECDNGTAQRIHNANVNVGKIAKYFANE